MQKKEPRPSEIAKQYFYKGGTEEQTMQEVLGPSGAMLGSKSIYVYDHPNNLVVFNAKVYVGTMLEPAWKGDLDVTLSLPSLRDAAILLKNKIVIKTEHGGFSGVVVKEDGSLELASFIELSGETVRLKKIKYEPKVVVSPREDYEEIDLPDLSGFKVTKKGPDPLSFFQSYFIETYGKERAQDIYRNLYVTKAYMEELEKLSSLYAKKMYPGLHQAKLLQTVSLYLLDMAPHSFQNEQPWERVNKGYVKKTRV
jgi:hypothetical protein